MAGTSNNVQIPNGIHATKTSNPLPDCIIASSNRFYDLLPFCINLYHANPQRWGGILPWEFPQSATKEVEEAFLRQWFTELEIHMQGGAHGDGAGFRFLKQAWYNIALWNYEQRIPAIATWWLQQEENSDIIKDPAMREFLCSSKATPETFFQTRDIETYGCNLLVYVVKQIQDTVKSEKAESSNASLDTKTVQLESELSPKSSKHVEPSIPPVTLPLPAAEVTSTGARSDTSSAPVKATPADPQTTPLPIYHEPTTEPYGNLNGIRDFTPSNNNHNQQEYGRKRGGNFGGNGGLRHGSIHDKRQQQTYSPTINNVQQNAGVLDPSKSLYNGEAPDFFHASGRVAVAAPPNPGFPPQGASSIHHSTQQNPNVPRQPAPNQYLGPSENYYPGVVSSLGYNVYVPPNPDHPYAYGRQFTQPNENQSVGSGRSSDGPRFSNFNDISNSRQSGDARRNSFTSRGSGTRGQNRGGRGRGGRPRDSVNEIPVFTDDRQYARRPSNESFTKASFSQGRRYGSAYQQDSWRNGSDQPQPQTAQPQRFFSEPEQFAAFQGFQGGNEPQLLPPFDNAQRLPMAYQGRQSSVLRHPPSENQSLQSPAYLDDEVNDRYIGPGATKVNKLLVYNIPMTQTESEVAKHFAETCDVEVTRVDGPKKMQNHWPEPTTGMAFIYFPDHNIARRVLDLREVELYGQLMRVRVPREFWTAGRLWEQQYADYHGFDGIPQGKAFGPADDSIRWSNERPRNFMPNMPGMEGHSYPGTSEDIGAGPTGFVPSTPANCGGKKEPMLPTVHSTNATPVSSGPNTPKKSKKQKKTRNTTPLQKTPKGKAVAVESTDKHTTGEVACDSGSKSEQPADNSSKLQTRGASKELQKEGTMARPCSSTTKQSQQAGPSAKVKQVPVNDPPSAGPKKKEPGDPSRGKSLPAPQDTVSSVAQARKTDSNPKAEVDSTSPLAKPTADQSVSTSSSDALGPRNFSDSDCADDSFHTANGSPSVNKQPQTEGAITAQDASSSKDSASGLAISFRSPTPPKTTSSDPQTHENVAPRAENTQPGQPETIGQAKSLSTTPVGPVKKMEAEKPMVQRVSSGNSIPPTPLTAYHTAPTTPAPPQTPMSPKSSEKPANQPKSATKKGPSQTESFSMFGKKQQKQKKPTKGKGSLKGKPQDSSHPPSLTSGLTSRDDSGAVTPTLSDLGAKLIKKPELKIKTHGGKSTTASANEPSKSSLNPHNSTTSDETASAPGEQSSPSKRTFGNLFGFLPGMIKSPSLSARDIATKDTVPDNALTDSKARATTVEANLGIDTMVSTAEDHEAHDQLLQDNTSAESLGQGPQTEIDLGKLDEVVEAHNTEPATSVSSNSKEKPKKNKKKNRKSKKTPSPAEEKSSDGSESHEIAPVTPRDAATTDAENMNDADLDDKSDDSSMTVGRPTPPETPSDVSPSRRQRIEMKKAEREHHLIQAPAPRNKHVKRKSSNKITTPATTTPAQETALAVRDKPSETETRQRSRILQIYQISSEQRVVLEVVGDGGDVAQEGSSSNGGLCVISGWEDNAPNVQVVRGERVEMLAGDDEGAMIQQLFGGTQGRAETQEPQYEQGRVLEEGESDEG